MRLADIFHSLVRLTVTDCCGIATVTVMADKIARLTDIRANNARLCGYRTPYNAPTNRRRHVQSMLDETDPFRKQGPISLVQCVVGSLGMIESFAEEP